LPVERRSRRQNACALLAAQPPVGREEVAGDVAHEQPARAAVTAGVEHDRVELSRHPRQNALLPEPDLAAVVMRGARDPILAGETFDDQLPPVGQHYPFQAGPRLAGVRERLAPVDLPDRARRVGGGVLERLDRRAVRPRAVRLVAHDASLDGLDEMALPCERTVGVTFELDRQA
jgi:hypothetical protein